MVPTTIRTELGGVDRRVQWGKQRNQERAQKNPYCTTVSDPLHPSSEREEGNNGVVLEKTQA